MEWNGILSRVADLWIQRVGHKQKDKNDVFKIDLQKFLAFSG